ncbi:MAG: hypothetical protein AB4352_21765 [Hormoscilla sp.]
MRSYIETLSNSVSEIVFSTAETGTINLSDYHLLTTVVNNEFLSELERKSAQRVIYLIGRGRLSLVDNLTQDWIAA